MKTFLAKAENVERKWYVIDADGATLGRLATKVATVLKGKHKPTYTPNVDTGDHVIVINTDKIVLTGKKLEKKMYTYHTGYIGGLKSYSYGTMMEKKSDLLVYKAVKGMLPKGPLGRQMLTKLRVYKGAEHKQQAQQPIELKLDK